jgi:hypothetical protein
MKTILILITILLVTLIGCHKKYECNQHFLADLSFTDEELAINPYSGNEVLKYTSEDGALIEFPVGSRTIKRSTTYEIDFETARIDFDGCQGDFYYSEGDLLYKYDTIKKTFFTIMLVFLYQIEHPTNEKGIDIFFTFYDNNHLNFDGHYNFNTDTIYNRIGSRDSVINYHSQFILGGNTFFKVYELSGHHLDTKDTAWISTIYYSVTDGLLGFKSSYGKQWILN